VTLGLAAVVLAGPPLRAHDLAFTEVRLVVGPGDRFLADVTCDLDALALGIDPRTDAREVVAQILEKDAAGRQALAESLRQVLAKRVRVRFDGVAAPFLVSFPDEHKDPTEAAVSAGGTVFGLRARLVGRVPPGARSVTFWASRAFPPVQLEIALEGGGRGARDLLWSGEESPPFGLDAGGASGSGWAATALAYLLLGFRHIVPEGADHVLFVLGLFLLSPRLKPLLLQVSAFTLAHTATLALSTLGVVRLPSAVVEPLIALSIAYVAVENTFTAGLRTRRILLVFGFGLLHGLGFAGVLGELGLPPGQFLTGLLAFNAGVELGQLAVLAAAFLAFGVFRDRPWYRSRVALPLSCAIAVIGLYWTVARAWPGLHSL
jgi:HupE / UreJ protein